MLGAKFIVTLPKGDRAVEINQQQDTETIRLLQEISSKLDEKK